MTRKIAVVTWHDPFAISDNHVDAGSDKLTKPYVRRSVGWLIRRRPVIIAQTRDLGQDGEGGDLAHTLTIPNAVVKELHVAEVPNDGD